MPLAIGTKLGPYEINAVLGRGGMGEVYRARDTRLGRDVAIKILPGDLATRPDLRERFEREARLISGLSHPHICALYDVGHENGVDYLVMEYLEGDTLAQRLQRGPLPVREALEIGIQIAGALDRAHHSHVVHRDLKPGNIMLTRAGVKLLDFGLAKMVDTAADPAGAMTVRASEAEPRTPLTREGTILGTFQYMAPEQLEGRAADPRTDVFALGAILYEMITGRRAFGGGSQASLIAAIMSAEPSPISAIQPLSPPGLERVIRACLAKDPGDRIQTAHDLLLQLRWIAEEGSEAGVPRGTVARRKRRERLAWGWAGLATAAALVFAWILISRTEPPPAAMRFEIHQPPGIGFVDSPQISPDGSMLAFNAVDTLAVSRIWLRPLDALEARPLPGTEGARRPFWSPDSRFLAFFTYDAKLKRIAVAGGTPVTLCEARGADGSWSAEGTILFDFGSSDSISAVPVNGGSPSPASFLDRSRNEIYHAWPHFLPDGRHFLFNAYGLADESQSFKVGTLGSTEVRLLPGSGSRAEYVPPGFLVFVQGDALVAQRFDAKKLRLAGDPIPVITGLRAWNIGGAFSISRNGVLAYQQPNPGAGNRLTWVGRQGQELGVAGEPAAYRDPALSRDGNRILVEIEDLLAAEGDLWILDLTRGVSARCTFGRGRDYSGVWAPDGAALFFASARGGTNWVYRKSTEGGTEEKFLTVHAAPNDVSPDGHWMLCMKFTPSTDYDVWAYPLSGDAEPIQCVRTAQADAQPRFAPDGRWIAYTSLEPGRPEVFVQSFPKSGGRVQVSSRGGSEPQWRGDGKELFYLSLDRKLMAVEIETDPGLRIGTPRALFTAPVSVDLITRNRYAVASDGRRFLLNVPPAKVTLPPTVVVLNWTAALER